MDSQTGEAAIDNSRRTDGAMQVIGFGCISAWTYVVFFSRLVHFSTRNSIEHLNSTYSFACCGMIAGYLVCALLWRRLRPDETGANAEGRPPTARRAAEIGSAALLSVSTLVLALIERGLFMQPWCSITSTLAGFAVAVLSLGWAERFCAGNDERTAARLVGSFGVGGVSCGVVLDVPGFMGLGGG